MRITADEIRNLPDGSKIKLFLSGDNWDEDYGKVVNTIKIKDKLFVINDLYDIEDLEVTDDIIDKYFTIEAAYNKEDQYFASFKN